MMMLSLKVPIGFVPKVYREVMRFQLMKLSFTFILMNILVFVKILNNAHYLRTLWTRLYLS